MTTRVILSRIPPRPEGKNVRMATVITGMDPVHLVPFPCWKQVPGGDGFVQALVIDGG